VPGLGEDQVVSGGRGLVCAAPQQSGVEAWAGAWLAGFQGGGQLGDRGGGTGAGGGADGAGQAGDGVGSGGVPALLAVLRGRAWTLALRYRAFGGVCRHAGLCSPATASGPAVMGSGEDDIADPV
jgi:hypothetical protein